MLLIKKLLLFSPCRLSVCRMGTKNKLASLAFLQRKPYIDARVPAVLNRCVTGERLRERERESSKIIGMTKEIGHYLLSVSTV